MMEAYLKSHFPSIEADDVIQETFAALCGILPGYIYDPDERGHFRNYLTGILRNKARRALRKSNRQAEIKDMADAHTGRARTPAAPQSVVQDDDQSWREAIFEIALRRFLSDESVADRTKRIFERTALNGESPESVAASFKMTRHAVDQAKSRAMARLRELVKELESVDG
jgi:RNA polymerase sigma factor (sigma-70 family)